jgi:hypothetical protein
LVRKLSGNRPLARPKRRWENNTKTVLREIMFEDAKMVGMA